MFSNTYIYANLNLSFMNKKVLVILISVLITTISFAQKNIVKVNAIPFAWGEFRFGYERSLTDKLSIQGNVGVFYDQIPSFIHDIEAVENYFNTYNVKNSLSGFSSSIDLRIHFGSAPLKGFYLAPYLKYHSYDFRTPASFDYQLNVFELAELTTEQQAVAHQFSDGNYDIEITGTLDGTVTQLGVGLGIGWQFILGKVFVVDFNPIGFGIELDQVEIDLTTDVNSVDYERWLPYVQEEVKNIDYFGDKVEISAKGNVIHMSAPLILPTYRGSISIGFAF